jgi:hypothetical protein
VRGKWRGRQREADRESEIEGGGKEEDGIIEGFYRPA